MQLNVTIDDRDFSLEVPEDLLDGASEFFARMDHDMDQGWQMSRDWVDDPDIEKRCQIAADRLLSALETDNQPVAMMMAGYILTRLPGITHIHLLNDGDMHSTAFSG